MLAADDDDLDEADASSELQRSPYFMKIREASNSVVHHKMSSKSSLKEDDEQEEVDKQELHQPSPLPSSILQGFTQETQRSAEVVPQAHKQ